MLKKIDLNLTPNPPVINPSGLVFDNAKGGPYKYGHPIEFNSAAIAALHGRGL